MIGEPEMVGADDVAAPVDLVSDTDRPPLLGRLRHRPWAWAAGAVLLTSAVWAATLQATGYGRTSAPDLHGYHLTQAACATRTLQPLLSPLRARSYDDGPPAFVTTSSAIDHLTCQLTALGTGRSGWRTEFTVAVAVDLHRTTDPSAEFDAASRSDVLTPPPDAAASLFLSTQDKSTVTHPAGLGDRANLSTGDYEQKLAVRHGGAVLSLTLTATTEWDSGVGPAPVDKHGAPKAAPRTSTRKYAEDLVPAMRSLMTALARPEPGSGS